MKVLTPITMLNRCALLLAVTMFSATVSAQGSPEKLIGVLVFNDVLTSDVVAPLEVFGNASKRKDGLQGYRVVTIAPNEGVITTEEGVRILPDFTIANVPPLDTLIVGSAYDMKPLLNNEKLIQFVKHQGRQVSWLASNCSGAYILAKAGLLEGKRATTYPGGEIMLKARHPFTKVVSDTYVVMDENLITSNGGLVSYAAAFELLKKMSNTTIASQVAGDLYYDRLLQAGSQ